MYGLIQIPFPKGKYYEAFTTREYFPTLKLIVLKQYLSDNVFTYKNAITLKDKERLEFYQNKTHRTMVI